MNEGWSGEICGVLRGAKRGRVKTGVGGGIGAEIRPGFVHGEETLDMGFNLERRLRMELERRRGVAVEVEATDWVTVWSGSGGVVSSSSSSNSCSSGGRAENLPVVACSIC